MTLAQSRRQRLAAAMKDAGINVDLQSGLIWDTAKIVVDALRHVGPNATADQLRGYL